MKKILFTILTLSIITSCSFSKTVQNDVTVTPTESVATVEITQSGQTPAPAKDEEILSYKESTADEYNVLSEYDFSFLGDHDDDMITLYTNAEKENGEFLWDDSAKWLLEVKLGGKYYSLFDNLISNGNIYFDFVDIDDTNYILVRNISTASVSTDVYKIDNNNIYKTNEINLHNLGDAYVNLFYTSTPTYR